MFQCVFLILNLLIPDHCKMPLDISLRLVGVCQHLKVSSAELPCKYVGLRFHQRMLLSKELLANDVRSELGLDHQCCRLFNKPLLSLIIGPSHEAFDGRLNLYQAESHPFVRQASLKPSKHALNVDYEVLLGRLEAYVGVPALVRVHLKQILDDKAQLGVAHQA